MSNQLTLEVVTPHRTVMVEDVDSVTLPGSEGELGILPEHVPVLTTLDSGIMSYSISGKTKAIAVHWGYAQVEGNSVRVLAELAETAAEIDLERAKNAEIKAKEILVSVTSSTAEWEAEESRQKKYESKLKRSIVRQKVAQYL
ncbi:MAG TPA: F0F1 ATP synthase subunit epsilon [Candidatus Lambdaproteobacteria bacterium]|nr:F0F1 ATP synthase subunit epsilon [SAR324 cluster bacterium]HBL56225.1 F0F1 ATP synthase subunit epsilon [Deltaproteobacteria bacterium]HHZ78287.1 F0F1 ATP synthase subunit epsilon [Candidatus Lambdaproteobacteria bacterium]HIA57575.1 F0F1 ATP synthase subunit epsilon [Candidatus Lambdaproteobacteria bacterium]HIB45044.1 F0F1 ATP synthase subunit epsilon [Candidatus Lambdaproteobacteria bacterium]